MIQRHAQFAQMTVIAKLLAVMTCGAVHRSGAGIEPVRIVIIQFMYGSNDIISAVAGKAVGIAFMTGTAPFRFQMRRITMIVPPIDGMVIFSCFVSAVTLLADIRLPVPVVAGETECFVLNSRIRCKNQLRQISMAGGTFNLGVDVRRMIEQKQCYEVSGDSGIIRIAMTGSAGLVILDIMTIAAYIHFGEIPVGRRIAVGNTSMTGTAFDFHIPDMQIMRKNDVSLGGAPIFGRDNSAKEGDQYHYGEIES